MTTAYTVTAHGAALVKKVGSIEMDLIACCVLDLAATGNTDAMRKVLKGTAYKAKSPKMAENMAALNAFNVSDILATLVANADDTEKDIILSQVAAIAKAIRAYMKSLGCTSNNGFYSKLAKLVKGDAPATETDETDATETDETDATETDATQIKVTVPDGSANPLIDATIAIYSQATDDELLAMYSALEAEIAFRSTKVAKAA